MAANLDRDSVERAYARWAPVYDLVFDRVMAAGRKAAVAASQAAGPHILDVGVGTGLELPYFEARTRIVGVDISEAMLRKAMEKVQRQGLRQVTGLCVMDAQKLGFADDTFDAVVAPYVLTVVPDPATTMDELLRVTRPGGEVVLLNHFSAEAGARARVERWLARHSARLGWRPEFDWSVIGNWLMANPAVAVIERRTMPPLGLFTLVRLRKPAA